jgi:hypothetical protein
MIDREYRLAAVGDMATSGTSTLEMVSSFDLIGTMERGGRRHVGDVDVFFGVKQAHGMR